MHGGVAIGVELLCTAAAVVLLARVVLPNLTAGTPLTVFIEVWGPMLLATPLVLVSLRTASDVGSEGWVLFGAPAVLVLLAGGWRWIHGEDGQRIQATSPVTAVAAASASGLLLLLLGAAHDLTMGVGQSALVIAVVVLWMRTPDRRSSDDHSEVARRVTGALLLIMLLAAVSGLAGLTAGREWAGLAAAVAVGFVVAALAVTARHLGTDAAWRMTCWTSMYVVLLGLGALSILRLGPAALHYLFTRESIVQPSVARGFGHYAIEATLLFAVPIVVMLYRDEHAARRRLAGWLAVIAAIGLILARLVVTGASAGL